ncbi:glycosyltransferase [Apibacter adventoris]|uniref:glycosyltransferase n=1 Tax=Apibacter adventoris TaxID=1679466 RepID=UPI000CF6C060|nr:glycosyltransferase [Apibacter adventoris]PQL92007.1 hypothetical protein C4S76_11365 [Apibacter adventoris]
MKMISVIVLTYNQENFIARNLRGIFKQKVNFPIQLILSNDHSTDATDQVIKELIKEAPSHIQILYTNHSKNLGSTPNFYDALKKVTGQYIAFCEGDDYWVDENKLQQQYDFLENNAEYAMCFHQVKNESSNPNLNNTNFSVIEEKDYTALEIYKHWIVHTTSVLIKTEILENKIVKSMYKHPELLYFDTVLYMSASLHGKIRGFPKIMSVYTRHEAGLSNGINYSRDLRHNMLDEFIANLYGGKIKETSNWLIFSRSRIAFVKLLRKGNMFLAFKHLKWILKKRVNLKIYILKKLKSK